MEDQLATPYPEINVLLNQVLSGARSILGRRFIGMYLEGSLANGDFDQDSDIDFVVATTEDIQGDLFETLRAMHDRLAEMDTPWAIQLEGSYISELALVRYDPRHAWHPNLERGRGERLKMAEHDRGWDIHRWVLRERGITLAGPAPQDLIDPISPAQLLQAMLASFPNWAVRFLDQPAFLSARGYQSYVVLTLCRVLYTLQFGAVVSKAAAGRWAQEALDPRWKALIERAWVGRHFPETASDPEEIDETLSMVRFTLERLGRYAQEL